MQRRIASIVIDCLIAHGSPSNVWSTNDARPRLIARSMSRASGVRWRKSSVRFRLARCLARIREASLVMTTKPTTKPGKRQASVTRDAYRMATASPVTYAYGVTLLLIWNHISPCDAATVFAFKSSTAHHGATVAPW